MSRYNTKHKWSWIECIATLSCVVCLGLVLFAQVRVVSANPLTSRHVLDVTESEVATSLVSAGLSVAGTLPFDKGELLLDASTMEPKSVRLLLEPSEFKADNPRSAQLAKALLQTRPQSPVLFTSKTITRLAPGRYRVAGQTSWGQQRYDLALIAQRTGQSASTSEYEIRMQGPITLFPGAESGLSLFGVDSSAKGSFHAKLFFLAP